VDIHADVAVAARRIAWGKTINAGQTCIAPDYVLVQKDLKESLIRRIGLSLEEMHGSDMRQSPYYGRIIHDAAYDRLTSYLEQGTIRLGGDTDAGERYIQPTILDDIAPDAAVMQDEIFGPILPVIGYDTLEEAVAFVNKREKPLALYYFGDPEQGDQFMRYTSSGGACINDTIMHNANHYLPFGGVGNSGMGRYHGRESFLAFSHQRSVLTTPTLVDIVFRYPPFKYFDVIRRIV